MDEIAEKLAGIMQAWSGILCGFHFWLEHPNYAWS